MSNEKRIITEDTMNVKNIIREYNEKFHANQFTNLDELKNYKNWKREVGNLNSSIY